MLPLLSSACKKENRNETSRPANSDGAMISAVVTAEETCLTLSPKMSALSKGLLNLRLPGPGTETAFAPSVNVSDTGPVPERCDEWHSKATLR